MSEGNKTRRKMTGVVTSDKGNKTIVVTVQRRLKDARYQKFVKSSKKYHAHDEKNQAKVGDKVTIIESRPFSKLKTWQLINIIGQ